MFSEICTLLILLGVIFTVRCFIFKLAKWISKKIVDDLEVTVVLDLIMNAILFAIPIALVWFQVIHPTATIFYGVLFGVVVCWLGGLFLTSMSTDNHEVREMPQKAPFWRKL